MQLRNGKILSNDTTPSYTPQFDGQDYMPNLAWSQESNTWLIGLSQHMVPEDAFTTWEKVYDFMNYNAHTTEVWCTQESFHKVNEDAAWFIDSLVNTCNEFAANAEKVLARPTTRSQSEFLATHRGLLHGIIRLATEIRVQWAFACGNVTV